MEITYLSEDFAISGQIVPEDLPKIRSQGFRSLICARPDGEAADQPSFAEIQNAAQGFEMRYVPIALTGATEADHAAFAEAISDLTGPVLTYCGSGKRAGLLWQAMKDAQ
ncbi:MAG: sulfur transferase domain-containing protein [Pseudomonadota bacterium]